MAVVDLNLWDAQEIILTENYILIDTFSGLRISIKLPKKFKLPHNHIIAKRKGRNKIDSTD